MPEKHVIKLPHRTGSLIIVEEPERIVLKIRFDKYGEMGDTEQMLNWLTPILSPYDHDPRPIVMDNPHSGEIATVFGDSETSVAVVQSP